jgi:ATP-dependent RNA helicase HelY
VSFFTDLPFAPDPFQVEAAEHIAAGRSVVVVAPTGAGKTLIAEYAVARAHAAGDRAFYTTPIKALSNQKYTDFRAAYGEDEVGLLTGDNVINGDAPIVVMTTEVLRNMIYAESAALDRLGVVVLDEVHYLQNRYRGSVWEEVIIHLPREIPLVCLSATIANPEEFTGWVSSRRGDTGLVVETRRPVPLESMYLVQDRFHEGQMVFLPVFGKGGKRANPQVTRLLDKGRGRRRRFAVPRRQEVAELLAAEELLPAIYFIFSRDGCDQAATRVAAAGLGLTDAAARAAIRDRAEQMTEHLPAGDLATLGYAAWLERLERGVAAHHAGMVPAFKETVEDLFAAGLLKLVFATETLSLGINMPARTVVLERLSKFTGEAHEVLQPGDYTQLTGRAGRRGIDAAGTAVVLHNYDIPFGRVAGIAAEGSHPLESSFEPTYNMAANLVANYSRDAAERLLNASFAQFRSRQQRGRLEESLAEREREEEEFRRRAECSRGDLWAYLDAGGGLEHHGAAMRDFAQRFRDGDVLRMSDAVGDRGVIIARGWGANPRFVVLDAGGEVRRISAADFSPAVALIGQLILPEPIRSRDSGYRSSVARLLRAWEPDARWEPDEFGGGEGPVAGCPDLADHLNWARRARRAAAEVRRLRKRLERDDAGLVPHFRRLLGLLEGIGS